MDSTPMTDQPGTAGTVGGLVEMLEREAAYAANAKFDRLERLLRDAASKLASLATLRADLEALEQEMRQIVDSEVDFHCGNRAEAFRRGGWVGMALECLDRWADTVHRLRSTLEP